MSPARPPVPAGPYLVVGLGRAGRAAIGALTAHAGADQVRACDDGDPLLAREAIAAMRADGVEVAIGSDGIELLERAPAVGCVVKSPGVPPAVPVLQRAHALGVPVIDELELGWRRLAAPVTGVTGTNGKGTVCHLLSEILRGAGLDAPLAGNTIFAPPLSALRGEPDHVVCEVSSYQLEGSPEFLPEAAVFTNLRHDHLRRHGDMKRYGDCKRRLFVRGDRAVALAVVDADEPLGRELAADVEQRGGRAVRHGRDPGCDYRLRRCGWTLETAWLDVEAPDGQRRLRTRLPGEHNARNALGAYATARELGVEADVAAAALARTTCVPGRFEAIAEGQPFDVIVDFAHTPDALRAVVGAARRVLRDRPGAQLHAVFGDAGHRPPELRRPYAELAARLADRVIVTEGSRRGRSLEAITAPLLEGAHAARHARVEWIPERRVAIRTALATAGERDVVLVLGRGAQPRLTRTYDGEGIPFDDRVVVREELRRAGWGGG